MRNMCPGPARENQIRIRIRRKTKRRRKETSACVTMVLIFVFIGKDRLDLASICQDIRLLGRGIPSFSVVTQLISVEHKVAIGCVLISQFI